MMKMFISHVRRSLPAFLAVLLSTLTAVTAAAQTPGPQTPAAAPAGDTSAAPQATYINNQTALQTPANFNIDGKGKASIIEVTTQYNINGVRVLTAISSTIFAGIGAGAKNTTGNSNAFFGGEAGASNTTGSLNTFVGVNAGRLNTIAHYNSFFGHDSGDENTTGEYNTFIGSQSGTSNTTGEKNSFVGSGAGYFSTTGNNNSFVGYYAGMRNKGSNNSFFGFEAGKNAGVYTGSDNTLVGANTNFGAGEYTFATAIGAGAVVSSSNTIALGRKNGSDKVRVFGLGSGTATPLCHNDEKEISVCSSSLRYKTNVAAFSPGLNLVRRLQPISFEWKKGGTPDIGFGAEDVAAVEPLLVTYNDKGEIEGVKYAQITTVLVNAVKEQQAQIEAQQKQLQKQQTLIDGLKKLLCGQNPDAEVCRQ